MEMNEICEAMPCRPGQDDDCCHTDPAVLKHLEELRRALEEDE